MWNTDTVTIQTKTESNTNGSIKVTWSSGASILCDVQPMSKEKAHKEHGLTDANEYKLVFAPAGSAFTEGFQVLYDSKQYMVRKISNYPKIGASNHMEVVLSRVI